MQTCKKYILLTLFIFINVGAFYAQLSKKHFIPPLTYAESGNANPEDQFFYISTPSNRNVSYTIRQVGSPNSSNITGVVSNTNPKEIFIANGNSQLFVDSRQTSVVHADKGYIIEAEDVIYVSIRVSAGNGNQAGALVSKGSSALGTTFRAGMFTNENPQTNYLNFISVMATENNTIVNFDDLPTGISIKNYSGTLPISNILLNEGESYIVATNAADNTINRDALIGTLVTSDKEIVVNIGSANGSFHNGEGRDYGIDQIVGVSKIGAEYIFVKGDGSNDWENILIVAHENNTTISINGNGVTSTINAGEYFVIEGNNFNSNGNMYVKTSKPVFAYQGVGANNNEANQGLFFVPPLSCENRGRVDNIPEIENIGNTTFTGGITIVTNKGATVNINSQPIANYSTSGPFDVDGNPNYVTYKVTNLTRDISIESSKELYCAYFNQNGAATSGSFYSGFPTAPEINFDAALTTLGNCIPNVTLESANTDLFDTFEWFFDDGTGFTTTGVTTTKYTPLQPGRYQLRATISCTMTTFFSVEVPISICPDDYDGDAIIDNLDTDLDNDGILNCDESLGNARLDISNLNTPSVVLNDGTIKNIIPTATLMQSDTKNTFTGTNNGSFVSTLINDVNAVNEYTLGFSQNINFTLKQSNSTIPQAKADEYFIIKITPKNKNITLLNPDNQLLIDTNNDDEFESGISQISASEIKFKYNINASGASSTFAFFANQVNGIHFFHSASNTNASTFKGNLTITCFTRDTDKDGIEDMFDLDSDNDGIPDLFDAAGKTIKLTNIDTNLDGLDDYFNTNVTNLDSDNDGIKNYLDFDSDNDGIFDATEAGHNLDANFDGLVDTFNDINNNGLADSLENDLTIKTLSLNYIISDIDTDNNANFVEQDSDNDDCFDVIEAGFTGDGSGVLNTSTFAVDINGKVLNNANGYTNPNINYVTEAKIEVSKFENAIFCEGETNEIEITTNADTYQWQISTDNGVSFANIIEGAILNGATFNNVNSKKLQIANTSSHLNQHQFKVILERTGNTCGKTSDAITLTVNSKPPILNNIVQLKQCAEDASEKTIVNLTEAEINISKDSKVIFTYYIDKNSAELGTPEVADKEKYPVNKTAEAWVRTTSELGCYTISKIEITASFAGDVAYNETFQECDDFLDENGNNNANNSDLDGIAFFDFSSAEQDIKNTFSTPGDILVSFYETPEDRDAVINPISDISNHRNNSEPSYAFNQTIYIKIKNKNNNDCEGIGKLFLKVNKIPEFSVTGEAPDDPVIICINNIPYTLEAENPADNYTYEWRDENNNIIGNSITQNIDSGGKYTVKASTIPVNIDEKICSRERTITVVESNVTPLDESFITIKDDTTSGNSDNLSIEIDIPKNPNSVEEYRYALTTENGVPIRNFQDSNIFENIEGGIYKIIAENKNSCGTSELLISVLEFPKFFTPNEDGINDYWLIKGVNKTLYTSSSITIFDRYGNLIEQFPFDNKGWNGTFNGKILPSNTYWYNILLVPANSSKPPINKKGSFSLLRKK